MSGKEDEPPEDVDDDPAGRLMAATGALIEAQMHMNEVLLQQLFAEVRVLTTVLPGAAPPPGDDDDRFDDVPV
jgi:hypothetical protein